MFFAQVQRNDTAPKIPITLSHIKMLSYRRKTALQGALVLAKIGRLELEVLRTL